VEPGLTFEGRFVRLEPLFTVAPAEILAAASQDRSTYAWTWVPRDVEDLGRYLDRLRGWQDAGEAVCFAQRRLADGHIVGCTSFLDLQRWDWDRATGFPDSVEIGATWLAASAQRTPINTEAKFLLMTHAFEVWHAQRVCLKTDARNARSRQAIERLGARFEGILRHHMVAYGDGGLRDSAYYSVLPAEWPGVREGLEARLGDHVLDR